MAFSCPSSTGPEGGGTQNQIKLLGLCIFFLIFTTILLPVRLYAGTLRPKGRGWDELVLLFGWMLFVSSCGMAIVLIDRGLVGCSWESITTYGPIELLRLFKFVFMYVWIFTVIPPLCNYVCRTSIVILFLRIFPSGWPRGFSWALLIFSTAFLISNIITAAVYCRPLEAFWDFTIANAECIDATSQDAVYRMFCILNIGIDLAIIAIPLPRIWTLHCSGLRKFGLAVTFASGGIGLFASCARAVYYFRWIESEVYAEMWATFLPMALWTMLETAMYFSAACFVGMRPILTLIAKWSQKRSSWIALQTWLRSKSRTHDEESKKSKHTSDVNS